MSFVPRPSIRIVGICVLVAACGQRGGESIDSTVALPIVSSRRNDADACVIDSNGIGGIFLGMSLGDARGVIPGARLERSSDGDGAALVAVKVDTTDLLTVHAGEDDVTSPIDWTKAISFIETFHPSCSTASGVRAGALVTHVHGMLGPVVRIIESEIESRQYITFERQPVWMTLRLDYSGVFVAGSRETTEYKPEARVMSVSINRHN